MTLCCIAYHNMTSSNVKLGQITLSNLLPCLHWLVRILEVPQTHPHIITNYRRSHGLHTQLGDGGLTGEQVIIITRTP